MDKNKENKLFETLRVSRRLEEILKPLPIFDLQNKLNNLFNPSYLKQINANGEFNKKLAADPTFINDFQRISDSLHKTYKIIEASQKELNERNIDTETVLNLPIVEFVNLYSLSGKSGLSFADVVEDSLKLFGNVTYEQAVTYLELLNSRKKQVIKNEVESFPLDANLTENLKCFEESIGAYIKIKLEEYKKGEINLKNEEKNLLRALKKNRYISNKELAKTLDYSERGVEELCAKVRRNFEMDFIEKKTAKRQALVELAKYIEL